MMTAVPPSGTGGEAPRRNPFVVGILAVALAFIAFMWVYAFFFASEDGINIVDDREWVEQAEATCAAAKTELLGLADYRRLEEVGPDALSQRADIVERANTILRGMVDTLAADLPDDEQGQTVIPRWIEDYRTYIGNRDDYVAKLRAGDNSMFTENEINGSPISNFIGDVARQNDMDSCQVPLDLTN